MDSSPSHFPGGLVTGSGTATPASSLLSSSTAANSPALTADTAPATRPTPDTSMDVSMTASDASNPLKRTIDQVDGDGGVSEGAVVVGPPPLDGASLGPVAPAAEMGTATTTAVELSQPDTTTKSALNKRGRPPGSKTVPKNVIPPPLSVPRPRRSAANPLNPTSAPPPTTAASARLNNSLAIFEPSYTHPTASSSSSAANGAPMMTAAESLATDVGLLRAAMGHQPSVPISAERTKGARPVPKTVSGPTRRGPSALNKGKGKASDDEYAGEVLNNDFCDACRGTGRFLCCDGCPRSFHFSCLDPPMDRDDVPEDQWFCVDCSRKRSKHSLPRPPDNRFFGPLLGRLQRTNATQYSLPAEIRDYFTGVSTSDTGAYIDQDRIKAIRMDRRGFAEDRDPLRLKDSKGSAVLCYRCGGSAAPKNGSCETTATTVQGEPSVEVSAWRKIMSCDYCVLHWHIDCLDPPLSNMPLPNVKWMCPNHIEHVMRKVRTPKRGVQVVEVTRRAQRNNGNIEIIPSGPSDPVRVKYEEMVINSKRYRVPEESIRVDFWNKALGITDKPRSSRPRRERDRHSSSRKASRRNRDNDEDSGSASDLTSLDSDGDASPDLGPEDFDGPSAGVGTSPLKRRPSGGTKIEHEDDLMTLTLTHAPHSPLRHAATARLNASKLRRSSLPPSMGQAIPSLLKDALSDVRPSHLRQYATHPPDSSSPFALDGHPPRDTLEGLLSAARHTSTNGDGDGDAQPDASGHFPKLKLRLGKPTEARKPTSVMSAASSAAGSTITATSSPTKLDASFPGALNQMDIDSDSSSTFDGPVPRSRSGPSTSHNTPLAFPHLAPPPNSAPRSAPPLGRPSVAGGGAGKNGKIFNCPKPGCSKSYKQQNGLKYHLEIGQCNVGAVAPATAARGSGREDSGEGREPVRRTGRGSRGGRGGRSLGGMESGRENGGGGSGAAVAVGVPSAGMTEEEANQLRSIRALMKLKSEEELLAFLKS